ncbi:MAG TPA: hypothetical protein VF784_09025, partial [Anaerolineales bacterium]
MTTKYVLENGQVLEAIAQGHTTRYLFGVGLIGEQTDSWAYDLQDGMNTPRQLVGASVAVTYSAAYTPWGDTLESHGTGNFSFGCLGGLMDQATGLLYVGNGQYYDPSTGRFMNRSVNSDSANPYVPWGGEPSAAFMAPVALLSLLFSRKKKRGKLDTIIVLVVLGVIAVGLSVSLAGCSQPLSTPLGPGTLTVQPTTNGSSTPSYTATILIPAPTNTPTETPVVCTGLVTTGLHAQMFYNAVALNQGS